MSKKAPKIEILDTPRQRGDIVTVKCRFNYYDKDGKLEVSREYSFSIAQSNIKELGITQVLKDLWEEKKDKKIALNMPSEIDW